MRFIRRCPICKYGRFIEKTKGKYGTSMICNRCGRRYRKFEVFDLKRDKLFATVSCNKTSDIKFSE